MNVVSAAPLAAFPVYGQYICTGLLIVVCVLLMAHVAVTVYSKNRAGREEPSAAAADEIAAALYAPLSDERMRPLADPRIVYGNYDRSFTARLLLADETLKARYAALVNELLGYEKVRCRVTWACATFAHGRRVVAKIAIKGKTLCLYLPLDPADCVGAGRGAADVSAVKKYAAVPTRLKVRSPRGERYALRLIARVAGEMSLRAGEKGGLTTADFPYEPFGSLLARGLIRLRTKGGVPLNDGDTLAWAGFERRERVSAAEVKRIALPEAAMPVGRRQAARKNAPPGRKCIVNIDTLSRHFAAGDTADLAAMKAKGLVPAKETAVKVLARGVLNKPLTVVADDFSVDAVKMILLTGGKVRLS